MGIVNNGLAFTEPADKVLASTCQLSQSLFNKSRSCHRFGAHTYWADPHCDVFYLSPDDNPVTNTQIYNVLYSNVPKGEAPGHERK